LESDGQLQTTIISTERKYNHFDSVILFWGFLLQVLRKKMKSQKIGFFVFKLFSNEVRFIYIFVFVAINL
jgi:hypothetical protein